jgi:DNA-binding NarL/FixJ family response regulator
LLRDAGVDVVAQTAGADDLLLKIASYQPDVAIIDVRMPPTHTDEGLRAAEEIRRRYPDVGILISRSTSRSGSRRASSPRPPTGSATS